MDRLLDTFWALPWPAAMGWLLLENVLLALGAIAVGHLVMGGFSQRPVGPRPDPLEWREVLLAASTVLFNTGVTIAGWWLWRRGIIRIRRDYSWRAWLDVPVLLLVMDFFMYLFHRVAHVPWIFRTVHRTHHRYDKPRPINLFVLSPLEVAGFGGLWLAVISLHSFSWLGICVYLTLNLAFGTCGHLGVEPFPRAWSRWIVARHIGTSTFHAEHHQSPQFNFGFYTLIWDRFFGTLDPQYTNSFGKPPA